jgi:hypothetical protein
MPDLYYMIPRWALIAIPTALAAAALAVVLIVTGDDQTPQPAAQGGAGPELAAPQPAHDSKPAGPNPNEGEHSGQPTGQGNDGRAGHGSKPKPDHSGSATPAAGDEPTAQASSGGDQTAGGSSPESTGGGNGNGGKHGSSPGGGGSSASAGSASGSQPQSSGGRAPGGTTPEPQPSGAAQTPG